MDELDELRRKAAGCTACELYADATQTVFGSGRAGARIVLAGEQPGDKEDLAGEPFVGPAGRLLDRFRSEGKRRIHRTPGVEHVRACLPWLSSELATVRPTVLVTLGATAAKALLGSSFRLTRHRGELLEFEGLPLLATVHPSAVLRTPEERREEAFDGLVADLVLAGRTAENSS
ncbi:MAG: uracil-DNA glycosylase [Actinomycetota bacterium]|nr:uracil-DNA glycosylase [Pseudonocardiales bacterium]MDQ3602015.1 uracil-DNA glycosylase [Actinomycetota bacterium]